MIVSETIEYGGGAFCGDLFFDDRVSDRRAGIVIFPTFKGPSALESRKARHLAEQGYATLVADIYGGGRSTADSDEARSWMNELNNDRRELLRNADAALAALKSHPKVDPGRTAAIGFCFGGKCALDLARSGADLRAIASFHGVYDPPPFSSDELWRPSVLILHGWEDPLATPAQTLGLADELTARDADWQIHAYGRTGHAFTNPEANSPETGLFYKESADRRSWRALGDFLSEAFA